MNIEKLIEKAYKNNKKVTMDEINQLNLSDDEFDILMQTLELSGIKIEEPKAETNINNYVIENAVQAYLKEMGSFPLLTAEEEKYLLSRAEQGDMRAKQRFIECNLRLAVNIAKRYVNKGLSFEDLIQEANIGLMKAVDRFDLSKGFRFSTYATWWINQTVTRAIYDKSRIIRKPVHVAEIIKKIMQFEHDYENTYFRSPTFEEIAEGLNLSIDKVREIKIASQEIVSLDIQIGEDTDIFLKDMIADEERIDYEIISKMNVEYMLKIMKQILPERTYEIIMLRTGMKTGEPLTLEEVGKMYNLTRERVRQIQHRSLRRVKNYLMRASVTNVNLEDSTQKNLRFK